MITVATVEELTAALLTDDPVIRLRGGTYQGGSGVHAFTLWRSVTLRAYPGETPILTYTPAAPPQAGGGNVGGILAVRANNVALEGLTFIGTRDLGGSPAHTDVNVVLAEDVADFTMRRCTLRKAAHASLKTGARSGSLLVEECIFEDAGFTQQDHHIYVSDDGEGVVIRHSVFTGQHGGYAIHLYNPNNSRPAGCQIYGNVIHHCQYGLLLGGNNHLLRNNTICDNIEVGLQLWKGTAGLLIQNNILYGNGSYDLSPDTVSSFSAHSFVQNNIGTIRVAEWQSARTFQRPPHFVAENPQDWHDYALALISPMRSLAQSEIALLDPTSTVLKTTTFGAGNLGAFGNPAQRQLTARIF